MLTDQQIELIVQWNGTELGNPAARYGNGLAALRRQLLRRFGTGGNEPLLSIAPSATAPTASGAVARIGTAHRFAC